MIKQRTSAASRYEELASKRNIYLRRGVDCAQYTIPSLISLSENTESEDTATPWQGIGARGVNNLTAKLLLTLLPPNTPFFKLQVDDFVFEKIAEANDTPVEQIKSDFELGLNKISKRTMDEVDAWSIRVDAHEAIKHLLVVGNVMIYVPPEGRIKVFHLNRYVCKRDALGNPIEIIVKETFAPRSLAAELRQFLGVKLTDTEDVHVYTHLQRDDDKWSIYQEAKGIELPQSKGSYPLDACPWMPLRGVKRDGEDYGRSYVHEYLGDLKSVDGLSQAIVEGSAAAAKLLFLVNPNGTTSAAKCAKAPNLSFVQGRKDDIGALQVEKYYDFKTVLDTITKIEDRLSFAFLLNTAIQRNGERVTAEEIRYMANELETTLGGVYSILSQDFQLPLVTALMHRLEVTGKIPKLPKSTVKPAIVTGVSAIGRGNDRQKLTSFLTEASATLGPETVPKYIKISEALKRLAISDGIDVDGLVYTDDEIQQQQQQAAMSSLAQTAAPELIKGAVSSFTKN